MFLSPNKRRSNCCFGNLLIGISNFILYFLAVIGLFSHFFIGPMRLIQEPMENGDVEAVEKILKSIWFPGLLYKPIRSTYYTVKGNLAMMAQDFDTAEKHLKKSSGCRRVYV